MNESSSSPGPFGEEFDYSIFSARAAKRLRRYADEIATFKKKTVEMAGEIGRVLKAAQAEMDHGTFLQWIEGPAGLSKSAAYRLMDLVDAFGDELPVLGNLPITTVQLLAAKSVPIALRASVLSRAKSGETLQSKAILKEIDEAKKAQRVRSEDSTGARSFANQTLEQDYDEIDIGSADNETAAPLDRQSESALTHSALDLIYTVGPDYLRQFLDRHGMDSHRVFHRACEIINASLNEAGQLVDASRDDFDRDNGSLDTLAGDSRADQAALDIAERIESGGSVAPTMAVKINNKKYIVIRGDKTFRARADILNQSAVPVRIINISELENKFHN